MEKNKKENQYFRVAKAAYENIVNGKMDAAEAWHAAAEKNIDSPESRKKPCPRNTFIGLCESGDLKDVKATKQSESINYLYAKFAIAEWKNKSSISKTVMWSKQFPDGAINHQGQLDVLKGIWQYLH